ncbi:GEM-like protein 4 [Canna indica]|uniref:GEM-like protein 4 n=1 Tax=Canna indica TaxID=4628 RepID=A0AAQ3QRP1_9LILI|nr:GEM-like protein 4 [Canna indica]
MKTSHSNPVAGIPLRTLHQKADDQLHKLPASVSESRRLVIHSASCGRSRYKQKKLDSLIDWMSKFSKKADRYAQSIRDHVSLGTNFSETLKGKFNLGTKILQAGGVERVFRKNFCIEKGEKLLKAFQCYLSTTAGPIAGMLFISNKKIAFHSDRSLRLTSPKGNLARVPYKVLIPVERVKRASQSENCEKPNERYIQIVTVDDFEFWFMGFISYQRSFKYLGQAISQSQVGVLQLTQS